MKKSADFVSNSSRTSACSCRVATMRATVQAVYGMADEMCDDGPLAEKHFAERFMDHPKQDFHTVVGFNQIMEWEREYMSKER